MLPTKTKPKKLTIAGSNGCRYTYLVKGREDLRLDERMMQLLQSINTVLASDRKTSALGLRTRNYTVIPLGDRSGLIQWVDRAVPLFAVYPVYHSIRKI